MHKLFKRLRISKTFNDFIPSLVFNNQLSRIDGRVISYQEFYKIAKVVKDDAPYPVV